MGKTKAQQQKEYHEKLKENDNEKYLKDARETEEELHFFGKIWVEQR